MPGERLGERYVGVVIDDGAEVKEGRVEQADRAPERGDKDQRLHTKN